MKGLKILKEQWKYAYAKVVNKTRSVSLKNRRLEKKQLAPFAVSFSLREKFPNTKFFWSVFFCIQTECRKIGTKKTPYLDIFHAVNFSVCLNILWKLGLLRLILEMCPFFQKLLIKKIPPCFSILHSTHYKANLRSIFRRS